MPGACAFLRLSGRARISSTADEGAMSTSALNPLDRLLVEQCRHHDPAAWVQLDARMRERALDLLPKALGKNAVNKALIDELTVDTFAELFSNEKQLASCYRSWDSLDRFLDYVLNRAVQHELH